MPAPPGWPQDVIPRRPVANGSTMSLDTIPLPAPTPLIDPRTSLPAFPRGWFSPAVGSEVKAESLVARRFLGQSVVVARTAGGDAGVLDSICPHLGADLSFGGKVEGEAVRSCVTPVSRAAGKEEEEDTSSYHRAKEIVSCHAFTSYW